MATTNDITGNTIQTKGVTDAYRDGWDRIFGQKKREAALAELAQLSQDLGMYDSEFRCDICRDTKRVGLGDPCPACARYDEKV